MPKYVKALHRSRKAFPTSMQGFPIFIKNMVELANFVEIITIAMARLSKEVSEQKKQHGRDLYMKGFVVEVISEIIGMAATTVRKWAKEGNWELARQSNYIALGELRQTILESFIALKNGEVPTIKPDEAAKYASAFEKLSDKRKVLSFMHESYEMLTDELTKSVQNAKGKVAKEKALMVLKITRATSETIITKLTAEALNENM